MIIFCLSCGCFFFGAGAADSLELEELEPDDEEEEPCEDCELGPKLELEPDPVPELELPADEEAGCALTTMDGWIVTASSWVKEGGLASHVVGPESG